MSEMKIAEYQKVELGILSNIHDFCEAKGITYFLYYGSLLGAIRHGGPIPWDDDIDIAMPRKDYDRFIREYVDSSELRLVAFERGNSFVRNARVCDMWHTVVTVEVPFSSEKCGVWVDVVALDGIYEDAKKESARREKILWLKRRMVEARRSMNWVSESANLLTKFKRLIKCIVFPLFRRHWLRQFYQLISEVDYDCASKCGSLMVSTYGEREYVQRSWVDQTRLVDFAELQVRVPYEAEKILECIYGDWRKPMKPDGDQYFTHYLSVESRNHE